MLEPALGQGGPECVGAHLREPWGRFELGDRHQPHGAIDEDPGTFAGDGGDPTDGGRIGLVPNFHVGT